MEARRLVRLAGVFLSLGADACFRDEQPAGLTAGGSSGGTSTGEIPFPEPDPTTSGSTTGTVDPGTTGEPPVSTGTPGSYCGDGTVDVGEQCDDGADNSNTGACSHKCLDAACGDGYVWKGVEQCDLGASNSFEYGGCRPDDCTWGPRCGDGVVDPEEECDLAELNGTGDEVEGHSACSATCRWVGRLVFVSSATYTGMLGGVPGADLKCQALAQAVGLTNPFKFRAWISDGILSPNTRFEQIDLTDAPFILRDGRIVAASFTELVESGPRTGISLTEQGMQTLQQLVWTNTSPFGESFSATKHCADWTSSSASSVARAGLNAVKVEQGAEWDNWRAQRQWTSVLTDYCSKLARLYCFEDAAPDLVP